MHNASSPLTTRLRRASALRVLGLPAGAVDPAQVQQRWRQLAMQVSEVKMKEALG